MVEKNLSETFVNPLVKRLKKDKTEVTNVATYGGVFKKCLFFMFMIVVGAGMAIAFSYLPEKFESDDSIVIGVVEGYGAIVALIAFLITPFIAIFAKKVTHIFGSISCIAVGYIIAFMATVVPEYRSIVYLAILFTFILVLTMMVLYATGIVKVNKIFKSIVMTTFIATILISITLLILYLIPSTKFIFELVFDNFAIALAFSLLGIFLASAFLIMDFKVVQDTIENKLDKSVEWYVSYSLTFTIIWLYFEVLNLLTLLNRD